MANRFESNGVQKEIEFGISKMIWRTIDRYIQRCTTTKTIDKLDIHIVGASNRVVIDINNSDYKAAFDYSTTTDVKLKYISKGGMEYLILNTENVVDISNKEGNSNGNICDERCTRSTESI